MPPRRPAPPLPARPDKWYLGDGSGAVAVYGQGLGHGQLDPEPKFLFADVAGRDDFPGIQFRGAGKVRTIELEERAPRVVGPVTVTPYRVDHASGAPAFALRVDCGGRALTYSGDTAWTESLVDAARDTELFVCEAYVFERQVKYHLDYRTLERERPRLTCRRIVLTHMSDDMLAHASKAARRMVRVPPARGQRSRPGRRCAGRRASRAARTRRCKVSSCA